MWHAGLVAPRYVGSSRTRERTCVPCIGRRILNHCTTKEVPRLPFDQPRATEAISHPFEMALAHLSGPTDQCSTAVHKEPFSTSAFKVVFEYCCYPQDPHLWRLHLGPHPRLQDSPHSPSFSLGRVRRGWRGRGVRRRHPRSEWQPAACPLPSLSRSLTSGDGRVWA